MFDAHVLRHIAEATTDQATRAALASSCKLLREIVAELPSYGGGGASCFLAQATQSSSEARRRARALLDGNFRRVALADLRAAHERGLVLDGAFWDLRVQPSKLRDQMRGVQLLASDGQDVLLYGRGLELSKVLSYRSVDQQADSFLARLLFLLLTCRPKYVVQLEPLCCGAADYMAGAGQPELASGSLSSAAGGWSASEVVRDLMRKLQSEPGVLHAWQLLAAPHGSMLSDVLIVQASTSAQPLALRCLDISGSTAFPDADLARLLRACPQLEVLRAARTQFGPECLAALCGRPAAAGSSGPAAQHQQEQQGRSWPRPSCCARLHTLDISHCPLLVAGPGGDSCGSLLPRALCHLSSLVDLHLNGVSAAAAGPLFEAPEWLAAASGSSGAAATLARVLGQLTRLELLETAADCQAGDPRWPKPGAPASTRGSNSSGGGLAWRHVEALVQHCTALRRLALSSWQLAAAQGAAAGPLGRYSSNLLSPTGPEAGGAAEQGQGQLPSLLHLEVGWGAGGAMLWHLLRASPNLASLRVHAGAVVSDWHLEQLAQRCRYLARLELRAANVTEQGVACVLAACSQLTSLRLHSCVGALTDGVALTPPLPSWAPAFKIQELCLSGSACALLSDRGVDALLAPSFAALRCLSLRGCSRASDAGLWPALQQHAATLECLELEECGSLARRCKLKRPGALAGGELAVGLPAPLSAAPAADTVGSCQQLQALTIRGSVVCQDATALARLRESCAGVPSVVLSADAAMY